VPAPANDAFASATALSTTLPGSLTGLTVKDSTDEAGEPSHAGFFSEDGVQSIWFTFTPTSSGRYHFGVKNAFPAGTQQPVGDISVYSGSALGSLTELIHIAQGLHTSTGGTYLSICVDLVSGTTYHICVAAPYYISDGFNAYTFTFDFDWGTVATGTAPANDDANSADNLGTDPPDQQLAGSLIEATVEAWEDVNRNYPSVWYRLHAGAGGLQEIHVIAPGTNFFYKPYWQIYRIINDPITDWTDLEFIDDGSLRDASGSLTPLDCSNLFGGTGGNPTTTLVAGEDYLIYVSNGNGSGEWDDFTLSLGPPPSAPANDSPESTPFTHAYYFDRSEWGSYWVYPEAAQRDGTTALATADPSEPALAGITATRTVWYHVGISTPGTYKLWVESSVDCVLGLYSEPFSWSDVTDLTLVASDDDSGTGNWPEINHTFSGPGDYWLAVDSKTEGTFTVKYEKTATGSPPSNDDFASAQVISSIPFSASGTTVDATAETLEREAEFLGTGPRDTVWYKYVADHDGILTVRATCDSFNDDAYVYVDTWRGTTLASLVRDPEPPRDFPNGFFNHFDSSDDLKEAALSLNIINGQTYYIRVQTEAGGSEDFTLYVETEAVYLDLTVSAIEGGPLSDSATVYLNIDCSGSEDFHQVASSDATTVPITLTPGVTWETLGHETTDSATVYLTIQVLGGECYSRFHFTGEGEADTEWYVTDVLCRWGSDAEPRWGVTIDVQPGCH